MYSVSVLPSSVQSSVIGSGNVGGTPITFRGITFASMEHPSTFAIGEREHKMTSVELPGGGKIVNAFGPQFPDITLPGYLYGQNVSLKMGLLESYVDDGQEGPISWSTEQYYARAMHLAPGYIHEWRATFQLVLRITRSASGAQTQSSGVPVDQSLDDTLSASGDQIQSLYTDVTTVPQQTLVSAADDALQNAVSIRSTVGSLAQASASGLSSLSGAIGSARSAAQAVIPAFAGVSDGAIAATRLTSLLGIAQATVSQGQAISTVTMRGGSLFDLAAQQYGDPSQAYALADANGLSSPFLPANVVSTIRLLGTPG